MIQKIDNIRAKGSRVYTTADLLSFLHKSYYSDDRDYEEDEIFGNDPYFPLE